MYRHTFHRSEKVRKTKIIATIGPATNNYKGIRSLILSGANVLRVNFSHGSTEEHENTIKLIKSVREELKTPVAIMVDTRGPEVRVKTFEQGSGILKKGKTFTFYGYAKAGENDGVSVSEPKCLKNLKKGDIILANDGLIKLSVIENKNFEVVTKVLSGGILSNNKGLNFKNVPLNLPYVGDKDKNDLESAFKLGCDMISASFVNCKEDILALKKLQKDNNYNCKIIAKIESMQGIKNVAEILEETDGIMVARGDLGVEVPQTKLPKIQMDLINEAVSKGKIVIVATEMLESMITNPRPTRAETVDVANAVYNGASAVMLSAESAVGAYPDKAVKTMAEICLQAEKDINYKKLFFSTIFDGMDMTDILSHSATSCAFKLNAKALVLYTDTGKTASIMARYKPECPIIAITDNLQTYNFLSMEWNVMPILSKINNIDIFELATLIAKNEHLAKNGDKIIVTTGTTDTLNNVMKICTIE